MSKQLEDKLAQLSPEQLELTKLRHTAEHVLHTAMQKLYPKLKKAMGPATDEGFYFDFDIDPSTGSGQVSKISDKDFPKVEAEMKKLISGNLKMVQEFVSIDEAKKIFKDNPYKLDWVEQISQRGEDVSIYKMIDHDGTVVDLDLCSGPHLGWTSKIKAFKLLKIAGAYWHGDEKNKMLTRIYGTAFKSKEELSQHLTNLQEAGKRDHRKLGESLGLFVFSNLVGKGLPLFTPKGSTIRRQLEEFIVHEEIKRGYLHVYTPELALLDLYKTSGHYPYYKDTMYAPIKIEEEEFMLRPMTCPHHFELYKSKPRSYKELPMRLAELAKLFRFEKSGELTGLMRVRSFCLADAHIIATKDQAEDEINSVLDLIDYVNEIFGLKSGADYRYRLSLGNRSDDKKYYKDDKAWNRAEEVLRNVLIKRKADFYEAPNEAAFYGPKIDVQIKNVAGKEETAFTVQYDFVMPKRFHMEYTDNDGQLKEPIVIHRSSIGAIERTLAFLIEHYGGKFPLWLSPVQIVLIPIADRHVEYTNQLASILKEQNLRVEINDKSESMQAKIRDATLQKVPYMGIIGDKELSLGMPSEGKYFLSIRNREGKDLGQLEMPKVLEKLQTEIEKKL